MTGSEQPQTCSHPVAWTPIAAYSYFECELLTQCYLCTNTIELGTTDFKIYFNAKSYMKTYKRSLGRSGYNEI